MKYVVHCKVEPFDVYIGRPSKWGNPFTHLQKATLAQWHRSTREEAVEAYRQYLLDNPELLAAVRTELKGKVLGCWCAPRACHGDILAKIANEE